jgi:hypothetical protein
MLFAGKLHTDGMIDPSQSDAFKKSELWSYIYYLYYYNNSDIEEFKGMKNPENGKADAVMFYNVVNAVANYQIDNITTSKQETVPFTNITLITFINRVLAAHVETDDIINPIFDYLKVITQKHVFPTMEGIKIVTGREDQGQVQVAKDGQKGNIQISIRQTNHS